jgi:uncharacterized protein YjlB
MAQHPLLFHCSDNGDFPGNRVPVILYKNVLRLPILFKAFYIKRTFSRHGWTNAWNSGIFTYSHYHSTTHEVLGFFRGKTTILLGGEIGHKVEVCKGDVLIIPAGVAHKNMGSEYQVKCIGAYPGGRNYDINTGLPGERPATDQNIRALPLPEEDPLYGSREGLHKIWARVLHPPE